MNAWQAVVETVKLFTEKERPNHALAAVVVFAIVFVGVALVTTMGAQVLGAVIQTAITRWS